MEVLHADEVLFNTPRTDESVEDTDASSLVVRPAGTSTTEGLLSHHSTRAFIVVVDVSSSIAESVGSSEKSLALGGESITDFRSVFWWKKEQKAKLTWLLSKHTR